MKYPKCEDTRRCFAKVLFYAETCCEALESTYKIDGECPFCKAKRVTVKKNDRSKSKR